MSKEEKKTEEKQETKSEDKQSFWTTLPGIITGITGLVVAITGLVTALGENGVIGSRLNGPTPTAFLTATAVDEDVILPTPVEATPVVESGPPTCNAFTVYEGKANPNAVLVGYTETDFWVRYADIEEDVENTAGIEIYIFDTSDASGQCLRRWVHYLGMDRSPNWPLATTSKGREYNEVWMNAPTPPLVGELATWETLPDNLLIAVVDEDLVPDYVQVYQCSGDIPAAELDWVAYWHAATSVDALMGYLELYEGNGYTVRETVGCSN
jgi:hypothetical protein